MNRSFFAALVGLAMILPLRAEERIVYLVAGVQSHGPGDHEFNAGCDLLQQSLASVDGLEVRVVRNGWPEDDSTFDDADGVVFFADGGGRHPAIQENRPEILDALTAQGVGIGCMHYGVEVPKGEPQGHFWNWIGGHYEHLYSVNPMWKPNFTRFPEHPITRGVEPFALVDEWYFNMRWAPDDAAITPILQAKPSDDVRDGPYVWPQGPYPHIVEDAGRLETMMWAFDRPDGGRGFGFTGGHKHVNWWDDNYRKVVLNAILWVSGVEVPEAGVESEVSFEQVATHLDPKNGLSDLLKVGGVWDLDVSVAGFESTTTLTVAQAARNVIGAYDGALGSHPLRGSVSAEKVQFLVEGDYDGTSFTLVYEGSLTASGGLAGDIRFVDQDYSGTFQARRRQ